MNEFIDTGLSGRICTLLAPFVTLFCKSAIERRKLKRLTDPRREALRGTWKGKINYDPSHFLDSHEAILEVEPGKRQVEARVVYNLPEGSTAVKGKGGFVNDRFLRADYQNEAPHIQHFGTLLIELSADAKKLSGKFISFGRITESIITGTLVFGKSV